MQLYAGLDLHSTNTYIGILDQEFNRIFKKRVANNLDLILQTLNPFGSQLKGLVVESTYNWYWLIDGLMDNGYQCLHCQQFRRYYNRKVAQANTSLATKALSNKLARICYYIIRDNVPFREEPLSQ